MVRGARRARRALRPACRDGDDFGRPQQLRLRAAARGALARRHAADRRRRRLHLPYLQGKGPPPAVAAAHGSHQRRGNRSGDRPADFFRQAVGEHHPDVDYLPDHLQGLVLGSSLRQLAAWSRRSAPALTRSAASPPGRPSSTSASPTIGAATCRSTAGSTISTSSASMSIASARPASRPSRKATSPSARNSPRASGRPAMTSRR